MQLNKYIKSFYLTTKKSHKTISRKLTTPIAVYMSIKCKGS